MKYLPAIAIIFDCIFGIAFRLFDALAVNQGIGVGRRVKQYKSTKVRNKNLIIDLIT